MSYSSHYLPREVQAYLKSDIWAAKREERLKLDGYTCCVCGGKASQVHHLSYERYYGEERMSDLISLCEKCHCKAESIASSTEIPRALAYGKKTASKNFMAAMREDARRIAPEIFKYLKGVYGDSFEGLMRLRDNDWHILRISVNALCRKRYMEDVAADRRSLVSDTLTDSVTAICMGEIEHQLLNMAQEELRVSIIDMRSTLGGTREELGNNLGIKVRLVDKLKGDNGGYGPSLREEVLDCVLTDAAHGIPPQQDFQCLTSEDKALATYVAQYVTSVSGDGEFRGEEYKDHDTDDHI